MLPSTEGLDVFRFVVEQAPEGILFADREGLIQVRNNAAQDMRLPK